jgi:hypothetical protein
VRWIRLTRRSYFIIYEEEFEDTKRIIRICKIEEGQSPKEKGQTAPLVVPCVAICYVIITV